MCPGAAVCQAVLGQAPRAWAHHAVIQEMAEAMNLSAKALASGIAWHERLYQALMTFLNFGWRGGGVEGTLQAQLTNAMSVKLQVQGDGAFTAVIVRHLRQGQPMLTIQLPRASGAAPQWPNIDPGATAARRPVGTGAVAAVQGEGIARSKVTTRQRWRATAAAQV